MSNSKIDVIVVGGGCAGISAAVVLARAGKKVLLVERGDFSGSKNVFGGTIYAHQTAEIFPKFWETAPVEREIKEHKFFMLSDNNSFEASYKEDKDKEHNCYTVNRAKWDRWACEKAQKEGVLFAPKTLVKSLIKQDSKVIGIETEYEKYYANIVILADGVNSLLAKSIGLRNEIKDSDVALSVKEVIKLPRAVIEERFHLENNFGTACRILSGPLKDMFAMGFMYTNIESVSIGFGVSIKDLKKQNRKPYEILEELKNHPTIAPYIKDGELVEYNAHLIPEGGFKAIPKLYSDGVMIVGDAAMFVNSLHFEGTNLAMLSGKLAAETAIMAIDKNDFSALCLSEYERKIKSSIVYKDLKTYSVPMKLAEKNLELLLTYAPYKICKFFELFTTADDRPKRNKYRKFIKDAIRERGIFGLLKAMWCLFRMGIGMIK